MSEIGVVDSADEAHVVDSGQTSLESAAEREWPGNRHPSDDGPARRHLGTADEANQRRFAGAVAAQNAHLVALLDLETYAIEHRVRSATGLVALDDAIELDHSPSTVEDTTLTAASAISVSARFTVIV